MKAIIIIINKKKHRYQWWSFIVSCRQGDFKQLPFFSFLFLLFFFSLPTCGGLMVDTATHASLFFSSFRLSCDLLLHATTLSQVGALAPSRSLRTLHLPFFLFFLHNVMTLRAIVLSSKFFWKGNVKIILIAHKWYKLQKDLDTKMGARECIEVFHHNVYWMSSNLNPPNTSTTMVWTCLQ